MALILDGTNGLVLTGSSQPLSPSAIQAIIQTVIPTGTSMLFAQTSAPIGWTKSTTHNNKALRVVSGTAGSGGSVNFTTAFASKAVSGSVSTSGATTLSTAQIPSHQHSSPYNKTGYAGAGGNDIGGESRSASAWSVNPTGGGGSHTHSGGTFTGTAINLAVQYVDVIIAIKG
jgi:hypothetical protein